MAATVSIKIEPEAYALARAISRRQDRSIVAVLTRALRHYDAATTAAEAQVGARASEIAGLQEETYADVTPNHRSTRCKR